MTTHAPGMPSWVDLASPDPAAASRFYCDLFGWTSEVAEDPQAGGYTTFRRGGKPVAAVGGLMTEGQPPVWTSYFATEDAAATADKVAQAGGVVLAAPFDVMGYGRMAVFADCDGAGFAVWQAGSMAGAELMHEPGSLSWNELMTRDPAGCKEFYAAVFGWQPRDVGYESTTYTLWQVGDQAAGGMLPMTGDLWPADLPSHWMVYFEVTDPDATAAKAAELGGTISVPPTDTVAGRLAVLSDPYGALFSVIRSNPDYQP
ncbi:MAG TPA: VOC family protein [Natronosporangium sp.]